MDDLNPNNSFNLDINAQREFMKFYPKLGEKPATTVRFFDRTDFYSIHGDGDTKLVSRIIYKSTVHIEIMSPDDNNDSDKLPYLTLSKKQFEIVIRELLLVKNYRVEVYAEKPFSSDWEIELRGSPGNLLQFEDLLFSDKETLVGTTLISLQMRIEGAQKKIGLVSVEQNDCLFLATEFVDDDFFTELEATVVLLGPKECLLPNGEGEYTAIKTLMERNGAMVTLAKKSTGEKSNLIQDLNQLLRFSKGQQEDASIFPEIHMDLAMESIRRAINYLSLVSDAGNLGQYELKTLNLNRYVQLDAAAMSALNILPKPETKTTSPSFRWQSILGVLDFCRTAQGHRLMAQWVKQPLRSKEVINDRHDIVQCLTENPKAQCLIHDYLKRLPDVLLLTKKLMRKKASLQDLYRIYQVILRVPHLISLLMALENNTVSSVICGPIKNTLEELAELKQMVEQGIDLEAIEMGQCLVKPSFDEDLVVIKNEMNKVHAEMDKLRQQVIKDLKLVKTKIVKLETVLQHGYHLKIALNDNSILKKSKIYKILDTVRGGVRFTSDELTAFNKEFNDIRTQYEVKQKSIVDQLIKDAKGFSAPLISLNNHFAQLDCLVSFAVVACNAPIPYVRPKILDEGSGVLTLKNVRHPCLELQKIVTFIANDVKFKKDECNMFIITGPNMGGKSTYIRSVGIAVLLAHVGSFVPCSEATISMVDSILGRVGASDNIINGLSTFMVEMIETSGIIRTATEKSLVIIDELGRGTSTYEGCGIAWSIAEHLAKDTKCFTLFATHFHEITNLAETCSTVKNCHMAALADDENFTLLFQVRPGVMQKSFGIQVARLANFPDSVIKTAESVYREMEDVNVLKRTQKDEEVINKFETSIDNLSSGSNGNINEDDLNKLMEQFKKDIKESGSEYFKSALP